MSAMKKLANEAALIAKLRAETYQWFAQMFSQELDKEIIKIYQDGALNTMFNLFGEIGLSIEVDRFKEAIAQLASLENPALELKADFAACFLLDEASGAMPYASLYLNEEGMMYSEAERKMRELLSKSGLAILESFKEPSDHLAIYLSLMHKWCEQLHKEIKKEVDTQSYLHNEYLAQKSFVDNGILMWIPSWNNRLARITNCKTDFYQALGALLMAFLLADSDFLANELLA
ncbi:molecular chaperone TorD [Ignatzschineria rhizosphaerae]|uniref:Molecular chaperone TorD n=1 Tax=Ignatzschineria rhizosphaerae TaxID=2923279 RepID=A0ABY3X6I9_9GAMM|nr:molecular chaperone TorD [Ignatzschineria rhizosphaerae]UNM97067.1 molecular chaperone TorD [Ignatzschineria rhizosphaerae]